MTQRFNRRIAAHFIHAYEVRPRKDRRGVVYDEAGNVIETHEHAGGFKEP